VSTIIQQRKQLIAQGDLKEETLLDITLMALEESEFSLIEEDDIITVLLDMLLGGTDTTSSAICFLIAEMANNPEMQARLHDELDRVVGDRLPILDDIPNLPYLDALIREIMRKYSPAPLAMHETITDLAVGEYIIPANCGIMGNFWAIHHNPDVYPDPETFKPDRWIDNPQLKLSKYFMPFGIGPRGCPARNLAEPESRLVVACIFQQITFLPPHGTPIKIEEDVKFTIAPISYKVKVVRRSKSN